MKKWIAAMCAVLCLCFAGTTVLAQSTDSPDTYTIETANINFTFSPDGDWYILTRDNLEGNDFVTDYDQDSASLLANMQDNNIYFDAFDRNISCELVISSASSIYPRTMRDLHRMNLDDMVDQMLDLDDLKDAGVQMKDYALETVGDREYLRLDFTRNSSGQTFFVRQYNTVISGHVTSFTMTSYSGEALDGAMTAVLTDVLFTVQYTGAPEWLPTLLAVAIFVVLIAAIVLLAVHFSKKKRQRQAAVTAIYGAPVMQPMAGQAYQPPRVPYGELNSAPSAPPMVGQQPYQPYAPYGQQNGVPTADPSDASAKGSAEMQSEANEHRDHCCACGAPLKPGSHFCEQCGMRND